MVGLAIVHPTLIPVALKSFPAEWMLIVLSHIPSIVDIFGYLKGSYYPYNRCS